MEYRLATADDTQLLAEMNARLIRDEGHRNAMSLAALKRRMTDWIASSRYRAVLFEKQAATVGYCLFRVAPEWIYVRHYYVAGEHRRQGIATAAWNWLAANVWNDSQRIRLDVLADNPNGIAFWKSLGFTEYCVTMEAERPRHDDPQK